MVRDVQTSTDQQYSVNTDAEIAQLSDQATAQVANGETADAQATVTKMNNGVGYVHEPNYVEESEEL